MKQLAGCLLLAGLMLGCVAGAATYSTNFLTANGLVPDGDLNGLVDARNINGLQGTISHVSVSLDISGGFNGDLYVYLYHRDPSLNAASAILLNRVGISSANDVGYPDAGFSITLDDLAANDVHFYQKVPYTLVGGALIGTWQPDGRAIDPLSAGMNFEVAPRNSMLSLFNGMDPNGDWALYVADVSTGYQSTLNQWTLQLQTVPEPSTYALLGCALVLGWFRKRSRIRHNPDAPASGAALH